jgi:uncharacterized LabA/DUF88 family protein
MMRANDGSRLRVGLYVDVSNMTMNGGYGMRYDVLREFACRGNSEPIRLNAYVAYDAEKEKEANGNYRTNQESFYLALRDFGYKVIRKNVKWYVNENGERVGKANIDMEMAVDALLQSENIDRVLLATGDGDFVQVVRALQNRGCRVEIVAFDNVSRELREEADLFISGYLVPGLLPISRSGRDSPPWGSLGSFARGVCHSYEPERNFGFIRYLYTFESGDLWKMDARLPGSPYKTIFFHRSELPPELQNNPNLLPSRDIILEFQIAEGDPGKGYKAVDIKWVNRKQARVGPTTSEERPEAANNRVSSPAPNANLNNEEREAPSGEPMPPSSY